MSIDIIKLLEENNIIGMGGACFPAHKKWIRVNEAQDKERYVVCNASEGEPGVYKDIHIMKNDLGLTFVGIKAAMEYIGAKKTYFYLKQKSLDQIKDHMDKLINDYKDMGFEIEVFIAPPKYLAGERNSLMSVIEGKKLEPIIRKPSPSIAGINGHPTLIQNIETLFNVGQVIENRFKNTRFATINGNIPSPGVHEVNRQLTVKEILDSTGNWPSFDFFVQVGGGAAGHIYNKEQLSTQPLTGSGSIDIHPTDTNLKDLMMQWFMFFHVESCGKCAPCKNGAYQIYELVKNNDEVPWSEIVKLSYMAKRASFCGLGVSIANPIESLITNVVFPNSQIEKNQIISKENTNNNQ
jgi:NADH:ubiquinone oxidoreductase subunit F (NADH-binding)